MAVNTYTTGAVLTASQLNNDNTFSVVTGAVLMFGGSTVPTGWLNCDGTAVSRTTYAELFAIIGTRYGVGNGTTTFNLPNVSGSVPLGLTSGSPTVPTTATSTGTSGNSAALNHTHGGVVTGGASTYGIDGGTIAHSHSVSVTTPAIQFFFIIKT